MGILHIIDAKMILSLYSVEYKPSRKHLKQPLLYFMPCEFLASSQFFIKKRLVIVSWHRCMYGPRKHFERTENRENYSIIYALYENISKIY
jgi:hypothetical protein